MNSEVKALEAVWQVYLVHFLVEHVSKGPWLAQQLSDPCPPIHMAQGLHPPNGNLLTLVVH